MRIWVAVMAVLPLAGLVGCIGGTGPVDPADAVDVAATTTSGPMSLLEDPSGDATSYDNAASPPVGAYAGACVWRTLPEDQCVWAQRWDRDTTACVNGTCSSLKDVNPGVRGPAGPDALDIEAVDLTETPESLVFGLVLGEASASFEGAFADDSVIRVQWGIDWDSATAPCAYGLGLDAVRVRGEIHPGTPTFRASCADDGTRPARCVANCAWAVALDIQDGTPGILRFVVPRHAMPENQAGATFDGLRASTSSERSPNGGTLPGYYADAWPSFGYGEHESWIDTAQVQDVATGHGPFSLTTDAAAAPPAEEVFFPDPEGDVWMDPYRPDLDVVGVRLSDTPDTFSLTWEMAEVTQGRPNRQLYFAFGLPSGHHIRAAFGVSDGEPFLWSKRYNGSQLQDTVDIPVELNVSEGAPGSVTLTFGRAEIDNPAAGDLLDGPFARMYTWEDSAGIPVVSAELTVDGMVVDIVRIPPFRFQHDTSAAAADSATVTFGDERADAAIPDDFLGDGRAFELTYIQAKPVDAGTVRLAVGIAGAPADPPALFDAALWAVAVEADAGRTMVGYLRRAGEDGVDFCAPDTIVFADAPRIPDPAEREEIQGQYVAEGAGAGGVYTWDVPRSCFAADPSTEVTADAVGAGTYLLRSAAVGGGIDTVDQASGDGHITLMSMPAPVKTPRAWSTDANWLLLALGAVLVVAEVGVFTLRHRRRGEAAEDRLVGYRRVLEREVKAERSSKQIAEHLKPLRAALGISDREHAKLEAEVRTRLAAALGGGRALVPGERFLDRYEVVRRLPAGGGGRAYACRDARLGRDVVLKVLSAPSEPELDALMREARAFAAVRHESVVTLFDVERVGDEAFLVLEHVGGGSLKERLAKGPLSRDEIIRLGDDLLSALGAVHAAGIVHRDVKPANVLVAGDGRFKLADFGIAHLAGRDVTAAGFGTDGASGTLRYMSPEQARGERVEARSDLFSAAATLYEAWTGTAYVESLDGESVAEVQLRVASGRGSLERCRGPARLRGFFARALAAPPDARFQDAASMRIALLDALRGAEPSRPQTVTRLVAGGEDP